MRLPIGDARLGPRGVVLAVVVTAAGCAESASTNAWRPPPIVEESGRAGDAAAVVLPDAETSDARASACAPGAPDGCATACGTAGPEECGPDGATDRCARPSERCNGVDDDCDGVVDEDLTRPCVDACGGGTQRCAQGEWSRCAGAVDVPEQCNNKDDDCNGRIDDRMATSTHSVGYDVLQALAPPCEDHGDPAACLVAAHRFCRDQGCRHGGFGPVRSTGVSATVVCTATRLERTRFVDLMAHDPGCTGQPGQRFSPACNYAIHRHCELAGSVSGYGPLSEEGDEVLVGCVDVHAAVIETTFTELASHQPLCGGARRFGLACSHAIDRLCRARDAVSGFGPIAAVGDAAWVVCLEK